jgi:hypothetical protein
MIRLLARTALALLLAATLSAQQDKYPTGYGDTPMIPGQRYRVHDDARARPPIVNPGEPGKPPSDAILLFNGKDLSNWLRWDGPLGYDYTKGDKPGKTGPPAWKVVDGMLEVTSDGHLMSKEKFGDVQLHVEWASPTKVVAASQGRGNSGILLMGTYEIQVLDSYDNVSYADGQAGAVYGQYPPLVNASKGPGEWQAYDIVFEAPRFAHGKLIKPAFVTVMHNGVLLHHRQEILGPMRHKLVTQYEPHEAEAPLILQMHSNPVRYRNIWARRLDLDANKR